MFKPIIYLLHGCPFCMKLRLFLLEAGLIDKVEVHLFDGGSQEQHRIVSKIAPHLRNVGFPAAELTPGQYVADSDAIIAWFAARADVEVERLPTYQDYLSGMFVRYTGLYRENMQLKAGRS